MSVLCILSIVGLFSPKFNKNFANCNDSGLFLFLIRRMFIDKLSFIAESHISGHFINDALTTTDLHAFGITCNICRGSQQNITIFPRKKLSLLVMSFSILLTANMLYVMFLSSRPHPILLTLIRSTIFLI